MRVAIVEPHYDDAWINLGGYILCNPDKQFLIISLCEDDLNNKNETNELENILPNIKTKALRFKGIPWAMRDRIAKGDVKDFFLKKNKKSLFNWSGVKRFDEVELRVKNAIGECDLVLLPCGAKHPQHIVTSMLQLNENVKYYLEFPYLYEDEFWTKFSEVPQTVIDIERVSKEKIRIFEEIYCSQKAMLEVKSSWGRMSEVKKEIILDSAIL